MKGHLPTPGLTMIIARLSASEVVVTSWDPARYAISPIPRSAM